MNKAKKVVNVLFEEKKDFIIFNILADGKIGNFDTFKLDSPPRLVLDIWGVDTRKSSFKVKNLLIKAVRIGHYPDKLRLVFDSQKPQLPPYQVNRIDDTLIVSLGNIPQPSEPQIYIQEKSAKESTTTPQKAEAESRPKPGKPSHSRQGSILSRWMINQGSFYPSLKKILNLNPPLLQRM